MERLYTYVGPAEIAKRVKTDSPRVKVASSDAVRQGLRALSESADSPAAVTVTFVVDADGRLWVADRRSEHVACARGGDVLSAGEMSFLASCDPIEVTYVTNQSTGYCPRPQSWPAVADALERAGIRCPNDFSVRYEFRRCVCGQINIIKDEFYECCVCGVALPHEWNIAPEVAE